MLLVCFYCLHAWEEYSIFMFTCLHESNVLYVFWNLNKQHLTCFISVRDHWNVYLFLYFRTFVSQVITGYLPSLILQLFLSFIPPIMKMLSSIQGYISMSEIQKSACNKVLWFTIWNIFFANVLSGSALSQVNVFLEPKKVPTLLAQAVPAQVSIFSCKILLFLL